MLKFLLKKYTPLYLEKFIQRIIQQSFFDDIRSIDLMAKNEYNPTNNEKFRCSFVIIDKFSNFTLCAPLTNKNAQTITDEFSNILTKSKRKPKKRT